MVFVGWAEDDAEVEVILEVPFIDEVVCGRPDRISCEGVVTVDVPDLVAFPAMIDPIPNIVVDPRVVVRVVDPLVTVDTIAEVVIADGEVGTVIVVEYEMYGPVGVANSVLLPVNIVWLAELKLELSNCAFAVMARRQTY